MLSRSHFASRVLHASAVLPLARRTCTSVTIGRWSRLSPITSSAAASCYSSSTAFATSGSMSSRHMSFTAATPNAEKLRKLARIDDAVEIIDNLPAIETGLLITCEHASMRLPEPWSWPEGDAHLLGQHWSHDAGAEEFTRELSTRLPSVAVLARFSRLLCDVNRPLGSDTMFRKEADGKPVILNEAKRLTEADEHRRIESLYKPYHSALRSVAENLRPKLVLSVHSFTPVYEGVKREVEIGVLYNQEKDKPLAEKFVEVYRALGLKAALNEPWSAKEGYMYSADQFSSPHTAVIMLELRQDLAVKADWRMKVVQATETLLRENGHQ